MIRSLKDLFGFSVRATDGGIGKVEDFLFDEDEWSVRYLAVDSQPWITERQLLFSPRVFGLLGDQDVFPLTLDRYRILNSPVIRRDQAINRQHEVELHNYYQWPLYWTPGDAGGIGPGSLAALPLVDLAEQMAQNESPSLQEDPHLHSLKKFNGFTIQARDGSIGSVFDVLIEDETWNILYIIVDAGDWLTDRKVLISPNWVEHVAWKDAAVQIDLNRDTIRHSPVYDPALPLTEDYETRLYSYYDREIKR